MTKVGDERTAGIDVQTKANYKERIVESTESEIDKYGTRRADRIKSNQCKKVCTNQQGKADID